MKRHLVYLMLAIMLLTMNKIAIAKEESTEKIYHFVFKVEKTISDSDNELIMDSFRKKTDILGIDRCIIRKDGDKFVITYKTNIKPEDIIAEIQADKFSIPLTLLTYFVCDVSENKKHFFGEDSSSAPK